jgi:hypothetical protein
MTSTTREIPRTMESAAGAAGRALGLKLAEQNPEGFLSDLGRELLARASGAAAARSMGKDGEAQVEWSRYTHALDDAAKIKGPGPGAGPRLESLGQLAEAGLEAAAEMARARDPEGPERELSRQLERDARRCLHATAEARNNGSAAHGDRAVQEWSNFIDDLSVKTSSLAWNTLQPCRRCHLPNRLPGPLCPHCARAERGKELLR